MTYSEKLRDTRWKEKRQEILERDNYCCKLCNDDNVVLNVHHKIYLDGKNPWDYPNDLLITYCVSCHYSEENGRKDSVKELINAINMSGFLLDDIKFLTRTFNDIRVIKGEESYGIMKLIVKYAHKSVIEYRVGASDYENLEFVSAKQLHDEELRYQRIMCKIFNNG